MKLSILMMISAWWVAPLWMYGVFDDGMFYSCIARNLVFDAQETIWDLKVSNALDHAFNGHPPMAFWIQSIFFWIIGDVYWMERVFSLGTALLTIFLINKCWKLFNEEGSGLAIFFWLCVPIVGWSYGNNMLENVFTLFTTTAIWLILKGAIANKHFLATTILASLLVFGGSLVKGPVALYPLAAWGIYALVFDKAKLPKAILGTILMTLWFCLAYFILFETSPRALQFFERYFELQIQGSLGGLDSLAEHRVFLLQAIVQELLFVGGIILGLKFLSATFKISVEEKINWKLVLLWLFIAFSASLPMLISPKQLRFYVVPSMLFYCLSLATMASPLFKASVEYGKDFVLGHRLFKGGLLLGILFCFGLSLMNIKKYARSFDVLPDSMIMGTIIPQNTEVYLSPALYKTWNLHAYMYRYFYVDLSTVFNNQDYIIFPKDASFNNPAYNEIGDLKMESFKLYGRYGKTKK